MSEQDLNHPDIGVLLQQMRCKAVSQCVRGHALADLGHVGRRMAGARELARRHGCDRIVARKQPALGRAIRYQSRNSSSSTGESIAWRSLRPLPCSTRSIMRSESMSDTFRDTTSDTRRPAP